MHLLWEIRHTLEREIQRIRRQKEYNGMLDNSLGRIAAILEV